MCNKYHSMSTINEENYINVCLSACRLQVKITLLIRSDNMRRTDERSAFVNKANKLAKLQLAIKHQIIQSKPKRIKAFISSNAKTKNKSVNRLYSYNMRRNAKKNAHKSSVCYWILERIYEELI